MSSAKCPSCGLLNFSSAVVCRQCGCPLVGDIAQMIRASVPPNRKPSYRWVVIATLISIIFGVLLFFAVFLFNVIPSAMYSGETGWRDFTPEQMDNMKFWFLILLGIGVALIFLFFFLRRHKHETPG